MSLASDMIAAGNTLLGEVQGTVAGTITVRGGSPVAFTGGRVARHQANPSGDEQSRAECDLVIPVGGIASAPARDSALTFTGTVPTGLSSGTWRVMTVSQQAPGGETVSYRLSLLKLNVYGVQDTWSPGSTGG